MNRVIAVMANDDFSLDCCEIHCNGSLVRLERQSGRMLTSALEAPS